MTPRARERSAAVGIVALMVIAVLGNVLAARHYQRWDVTAQQLFTLSPATRTTLRRLAEPIDVYVFIPRADPLHLTVRHLLDGYRAETDQLRLTFVDPDADPAAFLALQQRFELSAVETEGGAIAADAVIVVARGDRRHFIGPDDLFEVADDRQARPRVERALTAALRSVDGGTAPPVCFTTGHRELPFDGGGLGGLIPLRDWLEKANFEPRTLPPLRDVRGPDPIDDCALVVVAGPAATVGPADAERLRRYFDEGGSLLVAIGPELDEEGLALRDGGLGPLLAAAGLSLRSDIVFEQNPARMLPNGQGELFVPVARRHPITEGFVAGEGAVPIPLTMVSSLAPRDDATTVAPRVLLETTEASFGMRRPRRWLADGGAPTPGPGDATGPLAVGYALELPRRRATDARGPRMVVFGTKGVLMGANWRTERLRGTGLLTENAVAWLSDRPEALDVPAKALADVGVNVTAETLTDTLTSVLALPLGSLLLGLGIAYRRRTTAPSDDKPEDGSGSS